MANDNYLHFYKVEVKYDSLSKQILVFLNDDKKQEHEISSHVCCFFFPLSL